MLEDVELDVEDEVLELVELDVDDEVVVPVHVHLRAAGGSRTPPAPPGRPQP